MIDVNKNLNIECKVCIYNGNKYCSYGMIYMVYNSSNNCLKGQNDSYNNQDIDIHSKVNKCLKINQNLVQNAKEIW